MTKYRVMTTKAKTKRWVQRQRQDPFVKQAKQAGWRSRAALKLLAMQQQHRIMAPGMTVLDLGAAPGSWCQVATQVVQNKGCVVAIDRLAMAPMADVHILQADINHESTRTELDGILGDRDVDVLLSDMAPDITGIAEVDQAQWDLLLESIIYTVETKLKKGGTCCVKLFHQASFGAHRQLFKQRFERVQMLKPAASRAKSREVYLLARAYRGIISVNTSI